MSYEVIARKWRPQSYDEVTGQDHVTTALRNAIRGDRMPHALLLTGPRGVGKTTLARLIARSLNCEKGPTDSPCGSCTSCEEITAGRSTDVREVDAASRTSVDDVRELIEAVRYAPSPGKHRIFVVDEVHMLSVAAFNALLKTLEEPPPRSVFVFATTNPEKIPFTVLSRCQRYDLRRIATSEVVDRLRTIAEAEGVEISDASLRAVAREGEGSMRDAQTLLDQLIAYGGGSAVSDETVTQVLDLTDRRVLLELARACIDGDAPTALTACHNAMATGADPKRVAADLIQLLRDLVVLGIAPKNEELVEGGEAEREELQALVAAAEPTRLRRMFRALIREQEDLAWAPQPAAVLEMAIVRLATMPDGADVSQLIARLEQLERQLAGGGGPAGGGSPPAGGTASGSAGGRGAGAAKGKGSRGGSKRSTSASDETPASVAANGQAAAPPEAEIPEAPHPAEALPAQTQAPAPQSPTGEASLDAIYDRLRAFAQQRNRGGFAVLEGTRLVAREPGRVRIATAQQFQARRLEEKRQAIAEVCSAFFDEAVKVEITTEAAPARADEPNAREVVAGREQARLKRQNALENPAINATLELLEAELVEITPLP